MSGIIISLAGSSLFCLFWKLVNNMNSVGCALKINRKRCKQGKDFFQAFYARDCNFSDMEIKKCIVFSLN